MSVVSGTNEEKINIFSDNCREEERTEWIQPNENSMLILEMGCVSKLVKVYMKNIAKSSGGSQNFSLSIGNSEDGPWTIVLEDQLKMSTSDGCSTSLNNFNIDHMQKIYHLLCDHVVNSLLIFGFSTKI